MEWMCSWCGAPHEENDPPCEHCGHGEFEKSYVRRTETAADAAERSAGATAWVCTECERAHPKHSPPCSRCGNMTLEHREVRVDTDELSAGGFTDLATRGFLAVFVVAIVGAGVLGLGVVGVVDVPGMGEDGPPIADAPGNPDALEGTDLAVVEADYLAAVDATRADRGATELRRTDSLDELATAYNRRWVRSVYGGEEFSTDGLREHLPGACQPTVHLYPVQASPTAYESPPDSGETAAELALIQYGDLDTLGGSRTGVDAHAGPGGELFVIQLVC